MTIHEMRCIYPGYAKKERELEELDRRWAPRIIQQIVDKAARDGKTEKEIEPGRESLPQPGSNPKPSKGDGNGG